MFTDTNLANVCTHIYSQIQREVYMLYAYLYIHI